MVTKVYIYRFQVDIRGKKKTEEFKKILEHTSYVHDFFKYTHPVSTCSGKKGHRI